MVHLMSPCVNHTYLGWHLCLTLLWDLISCTLFLELSYING